MYIYFISSLRMLDFEGEPPHSFAEFFDDCRRHLTDNDYNLICAVFSEQGEVKTSREGIQRLVEFNRGFQNDLVYFRAGRAGKPPTDFMRGVRTANAYYMEVIEQAAKENNLLDSQKIVDHFKWKTWDDLSSIYPFEIELIAVYGLKLRMLEAYKKTRSTIGAEVFERLSNPEFLAEYLYQTPLMNEE